MIGYGDRRLMDHCYRHFYLHSFLHSTATAAVASIKIKVRDIQFSLTAQARSPPPLPPQPLVDVLFKPQTDRIINVLNKYT